MTSALAQYAPVPLSSAARPADTDAQLVALWLHGRSKHGRPIQPDVQGRYWQFCVALAEARLEHAAHQLEQLLSSSSDAFAAGRR